MAPSCKITALVCLLPLVRSVPQMLFLQDNLYVIKSASQFSAEVERATVESSLTTAFQRIPRFWPPRPTQLRLAVRPACGLKVDDEAIGVSVMLKLTHCAFSALSVSRQADTTHLPT